MRERSKGQEFPQPWKTPIHEIKGCQKIKSNRYRESCIKAHHSTTSENQKQGNLKKKKKNSKEKQWPINHLETKVTVTIDFSSNTWKSEHNNDFFKMLSENICQAEFLQSVKIFFQMKAEHFSLLAGMQNNMKELCSSMNYKENG